MDALPPQLHSALARWFGFAAFRPGQQEAVRAAIQGQDALVVMPTGAGKSLGYQLPALIGGGLTLVVSPLVSLMEDQAAALEARAPGCVAVVHGQRGGRANAAALEAAASGAVRLLYVAPERFGAPGFLEALAGVGVATFVVDEAHCVSQWGHDFRPDYLRLGAAARALGARSITATTATATAAVAEDIVARLGLRDPVRVATGFDRPNLTFTVAPGPPSLAAVAAALARPEERPAIVYAGTRRDVDTLAGSLGDTLGVPVVGYHAGLERGERSAAQHAFMSGAAEVVVATNAFGMGVDKADVRTVVHAGVPPSLEAYYQEAGRAGRDGRAARALLLAAPRDRGLHAHFARRASIGAELVDAVAATLARAAGGPYVTALPGLQPPVRRFDLALDALGEDRDRSRAVLGALARVGAVELLPAPPGTVSGRLVGPFDPAARRACRLLAAEAEGARWEQYRAVWAWVEGDGCRRAGLLRHFDDPRPPRADGPCCDRCDPVLVAAPSPLAAPSASWLAETVRTTAAAAPELGPSELVAVLQGRATRAVRRGGFDALPAFGTCDHLTRAELLAQLTAGRMRVGVLASGSGTNLQALIDRVHGQGAELVLVGSDKPDCRALERASAAGIATASFPKADFPNRAARDLAIGDALEAAGVGLVVLAGYMAILDGAFVRRFAGRLVNVHPSLLPAFPGLRAIEQALDYGVELFGATVHVVDEGVDTGPILRQRAIALPGARTPEEVHDEIRPLEHELLCETVLAFAAGAVRPDPGHPRRWLTR